MVEQITDASQAPGSKPAPDATNNTSTTIRQRHFVTWSFCLLLICVGVFCRLNNLQSLPLWHDEALQLLHSSGTTLGAEQTALQNHIVTFGDVAIDALENGAHRKASEVLPALYYDQLEHAPLSFLTMHFWGDKFGWSVGTMRQLAVIFSILQIPLAFVLGWELSGSALGGIVAAALFACSPLVVHYSQELRDYSFTTFFTMAANTLFLRAYRKKVSPEWLLYPIAASLAIYSSILAYFTLVAHAVYVLWSDRIRVQEEGLAVSVNTTCFIISLVVVLAITAPLSCMLITNFDRISSLTSWVTVPLPPGELINAILFNPSEAFLWLQAAKPELQNSLLAFLFLIELLSIFIVFNRKDKLAFKFLVCSIVPVAITVWLPDFIFGGQRSLYSKYYIAAPTALLLFGAVAAQIAFSSTIAGVRKLGGICFLLVTASQVWSDFDLVHMTERGMIGHQKLSPIRQVLNENPGSLLVSSNTDENTNLIQICALTQMTPKATRLLWLESDDLASLPADTEKFFVFNPRPGLVAAIRKRGYSLTPVGKMDYFFRATKSSAPQAVPASK